MSIANKSLGYVSPSLKHKTNVCAINLPRKSDAAALATSYLLILCCCEELKKLFVFKTMHYSNLNNILLQTGTP